MELTTGQRSDQSIIDIDHLKQDLATTSPYKIFVDTIDENNNVFVDGEILVVHIARSEYNAAADQHGLVKQRVEQALRQFTSE